MTICIATPEYGSFPGGIATFYSNLVPIFVAAGHSVIVLTADVTKPSEPDQEKKNNNLIIVTLRKSYGKWYDKYRKSASSDSLYVASALAVGQALKEWLLANHRNYSIDIVETVEVNGLGYFLIDRELPAVVTCAHGALFQLSKYDFTLFDKRYRILTELEKKSLQDADAVITHSPLNILALNKECKITAGFATAPWLGQVQTWNQSPKYRVVVIGRLQACKGVRIIADALVKAKKIGDDIAITWVGGDTFTAPRGSLWSKFLSRNYASIWQKSLIWIPEVSKPEINKIIAASEIIVIPSIWESFGYISVEAAAYGKPIVISEGAGSSYLFKNLPNAFVVPAHDPEAILRGVQYFQSQSISFQKISESKAIVTEQLLPENVLNDRTKWYKEAVATRVKRASFKSGGISMREDYCDLRLPFSHYIKKFILKGLAKVRT